MDNKMKDNVWWTRKARIQAESRLLKSHKLTQTLLLWYSLASVFVAVTLLKFSDFSSNIDLLFTCFSIFILGVTLFSSNAQYVQKADAFKGNYIALQHLYFELCEIDPPTKAHQEKYQDLLNSTENHQEVDDARALVEVYDNTPEDKLDKLTRTPSKQHRWLVKKNCIVTRTINTLLFSLPILLVVFSILTDTVCQNGHS
jgi:hypothetical protein